MSLSEATLPEVLRSTSVDEVVHQYRELFGDAFPLLGLFEEKATSSERVKVEVISHLRKLVAMQGQPAAAQRNVFREFGTLLVKVFYMAEQFAIPSEHFAALSLPGRPKENSLDAEAQEGALEYLDEELRDRVIAIMRTKHRNICKLLSKEGVAPATNGGPTITIDGVSIELDYGTPNVVAAGVPWGTATTDIISSFASIYENARRSLRGAPTHMIYSSKMWNDYIAKNDEIREFYVRDRRMAKEAPDRILGAALGADPGMAWVEITDDYLDSSDTIQDMWPKDRLSFLRVEPGRKPFRAYTAKTYDNNFRGGLAAYSEPVTNPKGVEVNVTDNTIPVIRDQKKLYIVDVAA